MPRLASTETQLRTAKARIRQLERALAAAEKNGAEFRSRATRAEQEIAEWKSRFDALLHRDEMKKGATRG